MLYLILWIFFAVCCAILAHRKRRSVVIWSILGFFFSVFALILLAVMADAKPVERSPNLAKSSGFQICGACGDVRDMRLGACAKCGNADVVLQPPDKGSVSFESILLPFILLIVLAIVYKSYAG